MGPLANWYLGIPLMIEATQFLTMMALKKWVYPKLLSGVSRDAHDLQEIQPGGKRLQSHVDTKGRPTRRHASVRVLELVFIVYHFPVIVPTTMIRKDDSAPPVIVFLLTPALYTAILFMLSPR